MDGVVVPAGGDGDGHGAVEAAELSGAGAGNDLHGHLGGGTGGHAAELHGAEAAGAAGEGARDALHGDVAAAGAGWTAGGEHLAPGGGFEVAMVGLGEGEALEGVVGRVAGGGELKVEGAGGVSHGGLLVGGLRKRSNCKREKSGEDQGAHRGFPLRFHGLRGWGFGEGS